MDIAIAIGAPLWCERVWQGSGHVTFLDAPSTISRRTCHSKSKALHQLKKIGVISLLLWLWITRESSWWTYGFHILLAHGGSKREGSSGKFGTSLRSCAVLHPNDNLSTRSWKHYYRVPLSGHTTRYGNLNWLARDYRLPPRSSWELRSSGLLRSEQR